MKISRQHGGTGVAFLALFLTFSWPVHACEGRDPSSPEDKGCVGVSYDGSMERVYKDSAYVFLAQCKGDDKIIVQKSGMIWNEASCHTLKAIKGKSPGSFVVRADSMSSAGSMLAWTPSPNPSANPKPKPPPRHKSLQFVFSFDEGPKDGVKYLSSSEEDGIRAVQVKRGQVYIPDGVFKLYRAKDKSALPPFKPVSVGDFIYSLRQIN